MQSTDLIFPCEVIETDPKAAHAAERTSTPLFLFLIIEMRKSASFSSEFARALTQLQPLELGVGEWRS